MNAVRYAKCGTEVRPGDLVKYKRWFSSKDATVVYVPGVSPENKDFDGGIYAEAPLLGIRQNCGRVYGIWVDPDTGLVRHNVEFLARGNDRIPVLPNELDDPVEE